MVEHRDVVIIGAGLSGIGAACHLRRRLPAMTFAVLEARQDLGGTWDLFRYPGIRSDSDMFTFGYGFEPWPDANGIADGASILTYLRRTAAKYQVTDAIRFGQRVVAVGWDSETSRWTLTIESVDTGDRSTMTCSFLWGCTGYYDYESGHVPQFAGRDEFRGVVVAPQQWPADLSVRGKRVVVIGSGATAVTLVPALVAAGASVTMLQRSPTHIMPLPSVAPLDVRIQRLLPTRVAYPVLRWKHLLWSQFSYELSRRRPDIVRRAIREEQAKLLPTDYPFEPHLTPRYEPWDQRLCVAADGDFFQAIASGNAEIVTDTVDRLLVDGVRTGEGRELPADVVVLATGLRLLPVGGIAITVDGCSVRLSDTVSYKGAMLSGVPNFVFTVGYTNASWTLKADLVADFVVRVLRGMRRSGTAAVVPLAPPGGGAGAILDLQAGYVLRSLADLPQQGAEPPWRLHQNYPRDLLMLRYGRLRDRGIRWLGAGQRTKSGSRKSMNSAASGSASQPHGSSGAESGTVRSTSARA